MSVTFIGLEEVLAKLDSIGSQEQVEAALGQACALVERSAKEKAPKDTGALRRSITSRVESLQGIVYTPLEYAPYQEYGTGIFAEGGGRSDVPWKYQDDKGEWHSTSGNPPKPFMRPALQENREKIVKTIKESLVND